MEMLADCSPFGEFKVRNCLEQSASLRSGILRLSDLLIHHYPQSENELSVDVKMQLEQCHSTDRLAVTE